MASDQRKRDLDKSTRTALSGLDAILAELADDHLKPGEFTAQQAYEQHKQAGGNKTYQSVRQIILRKLDDGELLARKVTVNGTRVNAYRVP